MTGSAIRLLTLGVGVAQHSPAPMRASLIRSTNPASVGAGPDCIANPERSCAAPEGGERRRLWLPDLWPWWRIEVGLLGICVVLVAIYEALSRAPLAVAWWLLIVLMGGVLGHLDLIESYRLGQAQALAAAWRHATRTARLAALVRRRYPHPRSSGVSRRMVASPRRRLGLGDLPPRALPVDGPDVERERPAHRPQFGHERLGAPRAPIEWAGEQPAVHRDDRWRWAITRILALVPGAWRRGERIDPFSRRHAHDQPSPSRSSNSSTSAEVISTSRPLLPW